MQFKFEHIKKHSTDIYLLGYSDFDPNEYIALLTQDEKERCNSFRHPNRQMEFVATRILRNKIFGPKKIQYNQYGAPFIKNEGYISISHSRGLVGIALNRSYKIGLDLESYRSNILELYPKFLSIEEALEFDTKSRLEMTKVWSAKEALYKLAGRKKIHFSKELLLTKTLDESQWHGTIINPDHHLSVKLNIFERNNTIVSINSEAIVKTDETHS